MIRLDIQIVCSRPEFLVCIKPQGIDSESNGLPALLCRQENIPVLYPVHRLDRGTGGLIVLAKTPAVCTFLSEAFAGHSVRKQYLAAVQAERISDSGSFEDLLFHDRRANKSFVVDTMRKGVKKASCRWKLMDSLQVQPVPLHMVLVELHTGRTHQIRIQFASRGMPLFGDSRYGSKYKAASPALWACGLSFPNPENPERILSFHSDPPDSEPWNRFTMSVQEDAEVSNVLPRQYGEFPLR